MPSPSHAAQALLDVVARKDDNAPWCDALARAASHTLGGDLNGVPAEALAAAKIELDDLDDKKIGVGLVSMQIGQYKTMGEALGTMAVLATKVCVHQTEGNSTKDSLTEKLEAYTAMRDVAEDLRAKAEEHKAHLAAMLKCAKAIEKTCLETRRQADSLIKAAGALSAGIKDQKKATLASPQEEHNDSLALLVRAGLHFIVVEDIVEATRVHRIMAGVKDKPKALRLHPRAGCFMVEESLVIYVSPAGNVFFYL